MVEDKYGMDKGIGARVDNIRIRFGETKQELAEVIHVSPSYLTRLLDDAARWNDAMVSAVADHYRVSENFIITGIDEIEHLVNENVDFDTIFTDFIIYLEEEPREMQKVHSKRLLQYIMNLISKL